MTQKLSKLPYQLINALLLLVAATILIQCNSVKSTITSSSSNPQDIFDIDKLHKAALRGKLGTVQNLLKKGINVNGQICCSETPLHLAVKKNHLEVVKLILEQANVDVNKQNCFGETPLHWQLKRVV